VADYADVLVDIRGTGTPVDGAAGHVAFESVVQVDGSGERRGTIELDESTLDITRPDEYGATLGEWLATPAFTAALVEAGAMSSGCARIRLQIDERAESLHRLRWELLRLPSPATQDAGAIALADESPLSRYLPLAEQDRTPPADRLFTVLIAFANPLGLPEGLAIPVEQEVAALIEEFNPARMAELPRLRVLLMPGRTGLGSDATKQAIAQAGWTLVDGPASLRNIQTVLQRQVCHGLHVICHGRTLRNRSELTLEDDETGGQVQVADVQLAAWYHLKLQLIVFQSCRTATPSPNRPPFSHIAGQMLRMGVPAVVAMQDFVAMADARYFALAFYRSLLRDGLVDVAGNRGRAAMAAGERTEPGQPGWSWSIPALYMRLKGALLWSPEPVREYVAATRRRLTENAGPEQQTLPLKVIEHTGSIQYDPVAGASGSWYGMSARLSELLGTNDGAIVVLVGAQGSGKTAEARRLFIDLAKTYLSSDAARPAAPVLCQLNDLSPWAKDGGDAAELFADFHQIVRGEPVPERFAGARFVFLITESDQRLGRAACVEALRALRHLLERFPGSSCLLNSGDTQLGELEIVSRTPHVLVIQPMNRLEILGYLRAHEPKLLARLSIRRLDDLATNPWLLEQIREQVHVDGEVALRSRADVLERCISRMLARFDNTRLPLATAERILAALAWRIQEKRPTERDAAAAAVLPQGDAERLIADLRGTGEFSVGEMRRELAACGLIAQSGDGDIRFPIQSIRAFLAAQYLAKSPQSSVLVDNLAATFGRIGRQRYWTETLVIAAALPEFQARRAELLDSILTGSSMLEGEQAFLAARLYVEMCQDGRAGDSKFEQTVRQIVDSLVWRARDIDGRSYDDRRKAVAHLGAMRHPNAVPHLMQIAVDKVRPLAGAEPALHAYDYAGIRFLAMDGLWQQVDGTLAEVAKRPDAAALQEVIAAWRDMYLAPERSGRMLDILKEDEPYRGPIAAFAFLQGGPEVVEHQLLPLYWNALKDWDLLWCITEGLAWMDGDWLAAKVIDPAIAQMGGSWDAAASPPDRHPMLCFLIRGLGDAPRGSPRRAYLEAALQKGSEAARTWALRALATLPDSDAIGGSTFTPRSIAHAVLAGDQTALSHLKIEVTWRWRQAAFEVLRDAGDESSVELIRAIRPTLQEPGLFTLSFQVAEEIYWRLSGGMIQPTT
jgi:hypothetical protein